MFGRQVEDNFAYIFGAKGSINFAALYVLGVLFASLPALGKHKNNAYYNAVGASGAVSAVLYASILINPLNEVYMMFLPIPIKSWVFGIGYLALEYYLDKKKSGRIAHDAHYWGALFGFIFTIILKPSLFMDFVAAIRYSLFS
jgi:membrane associated rhomboid family serine protease